MILTDNPSSKPRKENGAGFTKGFLYSAAIHAVLLLLFGFWMTVQKTIPEFKTVTVNFQADMSDLPVQKSGRPSVANTADKADAENPEPAKSKTPETEKTTEPVKQTAAPVTGPSAADIAKAKEDARKEKLKNELNQLSGDVDQALNSDNSAGRSADNSSVKSGGSSGGDPLSDANWNSKPRKTLFYPDLQSRIAKFGKKGMSYTLTARIAFDKNGLAIRAEIIKSSGDAELDNIFAVELRKIRIEPASDDKIVEITKVFPISLK